MSVYELDKPWLYKNRWRVFPHTTMSHLNLNDCNDTIGGVCRHTDDVEQCIDLCANDPDSLCTGGYFIRTPAQHNNLCVPLRDYTEQETVPYYRMRRKSFYPEMNNVDSTFFLLNEGSFPPDMANTLFYMDNLIMQNVETGLVLGKSIDGTLSKDVNFVKQDPLHVQFLPLEDMRSGVENYVPIKNGSKVAINIPHTALILRKNNADDRLVWLMRAVVVSEPNNTFTIFSTDPNKKLGDNLNYGENFYLKYHNMIVRYNNSLRLLEVSEENYKDAVKNNYSVRFKFIPQVQGSYCDEGKCKSVSLDHSQCKEEKCRYKGSMVSRNPSCWGMCNGKKSKVWVLLILVLFVIVSIITITVYLRKRKKI